MKQLTLCYKACRTVVTAREGRDRYGLKKVSFLVTNVSSEFFLGLGLRVRMTSVKELNECSFIKVYLISTIIIIINFFISWLIQ